MLNDKFSVHRSSFSISRWITQPVRQLTQAAQRLATGDLDTPIPGEGRDEVGQLAQAFETMRAELAASYADIQSWNEKLEARVKQRTHELEVLYEQAARRLNRLELLREVDQAILTTVELEARLRIVVEGAGHQPDIDAAALALVDPDTGALAWRASHGIPLARLQTTDLRVGEGLSGRVVQTGVLLDVAHPAADPRTKYPDLWAENGLVSFLGVPMSADRGSARCGWPPRPASALMPKSATSSLRWLIRRLLPWKTAGYTSASASMPQS